MSTKHCNFNLLRLISKYCLETTVPKYEFKNHLAAFPEIFAYNNIHTLWIETQTTMNMTSNFTSNHYWIHFLANFRSIIPYNTLKLQPQRSTTCFAQSHSINLHTYKVASWPTCAIETKLSTWIKTKKLLLWW